MKNNLMKTLFLRMRRLARRVGLFPRSVIGPTSKERRLRTDLNEREIERLDRIRNPQKYLGK